MITKCIDGYEFLQFEDEKFHLYFSTAKNNLNFSKNTVEGIRNLEKLKGWFGVDNIGYLNQVHSDTIYVYDNNIYDGDAIITDKRNTIIGVFTADCVPVLIYDKKKEVVAAIHSGWKGTLKCIVKKTIERMALEYNSNSKDLTAYIGPHIMECCYEVSEDIIRSFQKEKIYNDIKIATNRNLSLQSCIEKQLLDSGVNSEQINKSKICTYCNNEHVLYSYRKDKEYCGRMFSFIFIK